ncbi:MAG TPA: response regulator [Bacteroidales bacterium]|nr:response regulator [Bacteroidales bacterium]HNR42701.1 response regulator [Bacteroidales bacterium]HPM18913.1 response regulator [Bacteroidales bacterium]HQG78611.1 response regulator [Bacteroidales bacterium]
MEASGDIRILIVEDELIIAEDIRTKLVSLGYIVTGMAVSADEAEQLLKNIKPDLVILDIMLSGERDGIDLARVIRDQYKVPFIFLTSYADKETVERARRVMPDGYLVKPFTDKDLFAAIEVAVFRKSRVNGHVDDGLRETPSEILNDCIFIKKDYLLVKIKFNDLLWIKSDGNYLELFCSGGKKHLIRSTLKDFINKLPGSVFLQIHKSYVVNINHIEAIEYSHMIVGNYNIPLGRLFIDKIKDTLHIDF